ncbi:MAG: NUDIX hydrolase [Bacilli bacterium]
MSLEQLDYYDENYIHQGVTSRREVHAHGLWHASFHCWVVCRERDLIFVQKRSENKADWPGFFDITCAGHLSAGEKVEDGTRELEEELGIIATLETLEQVGMIAETFQSEQWIDNEFSHVFLYHLNGEQINWTLQESEVDSVYAVQINQFKQLVTGEKSSCVGVCVHSGEKLEINVSKLVFYSKAYWNHLLNAL